MALEAGEAMHQVFAAVRIWQLDKRQKLPRHALATAARIFGLSRWNDALKEVDTTLDDREQLLQLAFAILHGSGFYDDPGDNIRTLGNMELATIIYVDEQLSKMDNWPIWVSNLKKPNEPIGIECVFDVVLSYDDGRKIRFIGTLDGLVMDYHRGRRLTLDENKTASRLDDGWINSFDMSNQVTGYLACASALYRLPMWYDKTLKGITIDEIFATKAFGYLTKAYSRITGLKIKPTSKGEDKYVKLVGRTPAAVHHWGRWVRHTVEFFDAYKDDYEHAPRYTHSCNRYFRPCSLIPFCADTADGRAEQWSQMVASEGSPSERAVREI